MKNLTILNHPLISHYISILRNKSTDKAGFNFALDRISYLMAAEIYRNAELENYPVTTPFKKMNGKRVKNEIIIQPILRAGLGLVKGFVDLYPEAIVSHIGIYRDEKTLNPVSYYVRFPKYKNKNNLRIIILEPMIATGGSAIYAAEHLFKLGINNITIASIICAPEGIKAINKRFNNNKENLKIISCTLDERLNENGYIVPGLGDAGDRLFGT
jgi:uracil phosphoribosyltransferase